MIPRASASSQRVSITRCITTTSSAPHGSSGDVRGRASRTKSSRIACTSVPVSSAVIVSTASGFGTSRTRKTRESRYENGHFAQSWSAVGDTGRSGPGPRPWPAPTNPSYSVTAREACVERVDASAERAGRERVVSERAALVAPFSERAQVELGRRPGASAVVVDTGLERSDDIEPRLRSELSQALGADVFAGEHPGRLEHPARRQPLALRARIRTGEAQRHVRRGCERSEVVAAFVDAMLAAQVHPREPSPFAIGEEGIFRAAWREAAFGHAEHKRMREVHAVGVVESTDEHARPEALDPAVRHVELQRERTPKAGSVDTGRAGELIERTETGDRGCDAPAGFELRIGPVAAHDPRRRGSARSDRSPTPRARPRCAPQVA